MENIKESYNWKTPVWVVSPGGGALKRVLRVSESKALIKAIDTEEQGLFKLMNLSNKDARLWLEALLFSGMRLNELIILKRKPYDGMGNPLLRKNGSILLPKEQFGDVGKQRSVARERVVLLSDIGRNIMHKFLDEADMPTFKGGFNPKWVAIAFDGMLKIASDRIGLQERTFTRTQKKPVIDAVTGLQKVDDKGKPVFQKVQIPQVTTGVHVRSFRSSWESWLVTTRFNDEMALLNIINSIGHNRETAMTYYLATQFDKEDIDDMLKMTEGFGIVSEKE